MNVMQTIQNTIETMPPGQLFGYQELENYANSPDAVIKAVGRMVVNKKIARFSKGKFYVPKKGLLGLKKPSDAELIRSVLYKNGCLRGYVTGLSLYNQLGLTTQVPSTITVAYNGGRQEKAFNTIRIKTVVTNVPIIQKDVKLLQYLDVLKDIKRILDSDVNQSLIIMCRFISKLSSSEQKRLMRLAENYYSPQTKALVGLLFTSLKLPVPNSLIRSLNPITVYKLKIDHMKWPMAKEWNIH